jgi:hypothetical protein
LKTTSRRLAAAVRDRIFRLHSEIVQEYHLRTIRRDPNSRIARIG